MEFSTAVAVSVNSPCRQYNIHCTSEQGLAQRLSRNILFPRAKVYQILGKLDALEGFCILEEQSDGFGY